MSCSQVDLKAYFLGEAEPHERTALEDHLRLCRSCREELEGFRVVQSALLSVPDEEIPRRIAFVSDKVFEPRWWQALWRSGPAMGFASAVVLAAAIITQPLIKPASVPSTPITSSVVVDQGALNEKIHQEVARAVADAEARERKRTRELLAGAEKRYTRQQEQNAAAIAQMVRYYDQQMSKVMVASNDLVVDRMRSGQ